MAGEVWRRLLHKRSKFSLDELRKQYAILTSSEFVNEDNRASVVEAIRSIAELLAWGEQHSSAGIWEHCMEHNILVYLHRVLLQQTSRRGVVAKQVLQTLNIMLQHVHSELGVVFLFSNNHLNNILELNFDVDDDEVLGHYVSLLKTISSRVDAYSIQFFFGCREHGSHHPFPLYSEAVKLAHHKEAMVRAAARTATLNIYRIHDARMQHYISSPPMDEFFSEAAAYLTEQLKSLVDGLQMAALLQSGPSRHELSSRLAEVEDCLSYCTDILKNASSQVAAALCRRLWAHTIVPALLLPVAPYSESQGPATPPSPLLHNSLRSPSLGSILTRPDSQRATGLHTAERLLSLASHPPLLHALLIGLAAAAVHPGPTASDLRPWSSSIFPYLAPPAPTVSAPSDPPPPPPPPPPPQPASDPEPPSTAPQDTHSLSIGAATIFPEASLTSVSASTVISTSSASGTNRSTPDSDAGGPARPPAPHPFPPSPFVTPFRLPSQASPALTPPPRPAPLQVPQTSLFSPRIAPRRGPADPTAPFASLICHLSGAADNSDPDHRSLSGLLRLLVAALQSPHVHPDVLATVGLHPHSNPTAPPTRSGSPPPPATAPAATSSGPLPHSNPVAPRNYSPFSPSSYHPAPNRLSSLSAALEALPDIHPMCVFAASTPAPPAPASAPPAEPRRSTPPPRPAQIATPTPSTASHSGSLPVTPRPRTPSALRTSTSHPSPASLLPYAEPNPKAAPPQATRSPPPGPATPLAPTEPTPPAPTKPPEPATPPVSSPASPSSPSSPSVFHTPTPNLSALTPPPAPTPPSVTSHAQRPTSPPPPASPSSTSTLGPESPSIQDLTAAYSAGDTPNPQPEATPAATPAAEPSASPTATTAATPPTEDGNHLADPAPDDAPVELAAPSNPSATPFAQAAAPTAPPTTDSTTAAAASGDAAAPASDTASGDAAAPVSNPPVAELAPTPEPESPAPEAAAVADAEAAGAEGGASAAEGRAARGRSSSSSWGSEEGQAPDAPADADPANQRTPSAAPTANGPAAPSSTTTAAPPVADAAPAPATAAPPPATTTPPPAASEPSAANGGPAAAGGLDAATKAGADSAGSDPLQALCTALIHLLALPELPLPAICRAGWLVARLLRGRGVALSSANGTPMASPPTTPPHPSASSTPTAAGAVITSASQDAAAVEAAVLGMVPGVSQRERLAAADSAVEGPLAAACLETMEVLAAAAEREVVSELSAVWWATLAPKQWGLVREAILNHRLEGSATALLVEALPRAILQAPPAPAPPPPAHPHPGHAAQSAGKVSALASLPAATTYSVQRAIALRQATQLLQHNAISRDMSDLAPSGSNSLPDVRNP